MQPLKTIDHLKHPFVTTGCVCMLAITSGIWFWIVSQRDVAHAEGEATRAFVGQWLTANVTPAINRMAATMDRLPDQVLGEVDRQASRITDKADGQLTGIRADAKEQLAAALGEARTQIGESLKRVDAVTAIGEGLRAELQPALKSIAGVAAHAESITKHVDDALPPFTDCVYYDEDGEPIGGNKDCAFNRFQGMSKAFEQMAQAGAIAVPKLASQAVNVGNSFAGIADDAHTATTDFVKPQTFWQKVKTWLELAARIGSKFL